MTKTEQTRWFQTASAYALLLTIAVIAAIETGRRTGVLLPAPFLLLLGSVAIAAGLAGLRAGLTAATIAAVFIAHSSIQGFGPDSLTGNMFRVFIGSAVALFTAFLLGSSRDKRLELTNKLVASQAALLEARNELAAKVEQRTGELDEVSSELSSIRNRLDSAIEHSPAGVLVIGADRLLRAVNPAALNMFGTGSVPAPRSDVREFLQSYEMYMANGERIELGSGPLTEVLDRGLVTDNFEFRLVRPNGTSCWFRGSLAPIRSDDRSVAGAMVIMIDVSKEKYAAGAMHELSRQLMKVQEDERTNLAYELHDEMGQYLTVLNLNLHALKNDAGNRELLTDCISQVDSLTSTVKNLSLELRPAMLDDLGLVTALRWYLARLRQRSGYGITFDANLAHGNFSTEISTACYRIVQEAVINAIRHANCTALIVRMYNEDGGLCIEIIDDGCGFHAGERINGASQNAGLGLLVMSERVSQLGGEFELQTEVGRGTRITACFPLR